MIKNILKQIMKQKRMNGWLIFELAVALTLVSYIINFGYTLVSKKVIPMGIEDKNVYRLDLSLKPDNVPSFKVEDNEQEALKANFGRILERVRAYSGVEMAEQVHPFSVAMPYSGSSQSMSFELDTLKIFLIKMPIPNANYLQLLRIPAHDRNQTEALWNLDIRYGNNTAIITSNVVNYVKRHNLNIGIGTEFKFGGNKYVVKGIIDPIKRRDYEFPFAGVLIPMDLNSYDYKKTSILIRTKEEISERLFLENFKKDMEKELQIGNFYMNSISSLRQQSEKINYEFSDINNIRFHLAVFSFILINIILGIMGSFWFRNRMRRKEIGLQMAIGSTRGNVQKQFIVEGILLLCIASVLGAVFIALMYHFLLLAQIPVFRNSSSLFLSSVPIRIAIVVLISWLFLALTIVLSAWIPAYRASRVDPVNALRDE